MKKSYNLIKAKHNNSSYEGKGTYKQIDETYHCPNLSSLHKKDEPCRYGEKVWVNEQVNNYFKLIRISRQKSFKSDSIDSGIFDSSTYSKSSTSLNHANISARYFRSIWGIEEESPKNNISTNVVLKIS